MYAFASSWITCRYSLTILLFLFLLPTLSFSGEVYSWTDEKGTVHFTDDLSNIPGQYLDQVIKRKSPEEPSKWDETRDQTEKEKLKRDEGEDRVKKYLKDMDRKIEEKKGLERKVANLEAEQGAAENRLKEIEELEKEDFNYYQPFKNSKTGRWVPVGTPYTDEKRKLEARIKEIKKELGPIQEKIAEIKRSL